MTLFSGRGGVVASDVDIMSGSEGSSTPFRYHVSFRNFICATHGDAKVRLCPPSTAKTAQMINDYENMEFRCHENLWIDSHAKKYPYADVLLRQGEVLFVPAYWIHSVMYKSQCTLASFSYRTVMSTLSVSPQSVLRLLQSQNTKHRVASVERTSSRMQERPGARGVICPAPAADDHSPGKRKKKRNRKIDTASV